MPMETSEGRNEPRLQRLNPMWEKKCEVGGVSRRRPYLNVCVWIQSDAAGLIQQEKAEVWMAIWKMTVIGFYCG